MQLQMFLTRERALAIPEWTPPKGYVVRPYRPGDEIQWSELLVERGFPEWKDVKKLVEEGLTEPERRDGTRFIEYEGRKIVAATMASQRGVNPPAGALDYVVASTRHAGKKLGYGVCAAVIRYLVGRGYPRIVLGTDDWRLPAIKTYLKLGFEADLVCDTDMPERWGKVFAELERPASERGLTSP